MYLTESLKYPLKDLKEFLIGAVMIVLSMLVFPIVFLMGYVIGVMSATVKKDDKMPVWGDWGNLLSKGLGSLLISIAYGLVLIPFVIFLVFAMSILGSSSGEPNMLFWLFMAVLFVLMIPYSIYMQLAQVRYADKGNINAAFEIKEIYGNLKRGFKDYIVNTIAIIIISFILEGAVFLLSMVVIGILLMPFVYFYLAIAQSRLYASIYAAHTQ